MFDLDDTIAALATAPGPAALALLRVSGRRAFSVGDAVFRGRVRLADRPGFTVAHGWAVAAEMTPAVGDEAAAGGAAAPTEPSPAASRGAAAPPFGHVIDEVLATVFRAPHSYTGEDMVEFSCHGGAATTAALLAALLRAGARPAEPGEFSRRAFVNGRMDLAQAESVADLVSARTDRARESAVARLQGEFSRAVRAMGLRTREILMDCETYLDFQEQLPDDFAWELRAAGARGLASEVEALLAGASAGRRLREGARVVLTGRPNAGKSSLLNALLREERALVSEVPGTTRDVLRETIDLGGVPVTLVDTAGLGEPPISSGGTGSAPPPGQLELAGMELARRELAAADALVLVVDVSVPVSVDDREALERLAHRRGVVAANKVDLGDAWGEAREGVAPATAPSPGAAPVQAAAGSALWPVVRTSARTGAGVAELAAALRTLLLGDAGREAPLVATVRQEHALRAASLALTAAAERLDAHELLDTAAFELREALSAFDEALGIGASAPVLDEIFSRFCIGK